MDPRALSVIHTHVFEATPGGGNPAPVVLNASHLTTEQMQGMAASFGAETVFVLDPLQEDSHARFRFFVPQHEMEMCIHATIGAVTVLLDQHRLVRSPGRIETLLGPITVEWMEGRSGGEITVEQFSPFFATENPSLEEVATALGLPETAIRLDWGPIQSVSTARAKLLIPIADYTYLDNLQPDFEALWTLCDRYQTTGFYPFTLGTRSVLFQAEARQFPKRAGYNEDPATGVAACALGAYLTEHQVLQPKLQGWQTFTIGQGYAMGKPSLLTAATEVSTGAITRTCVKGRARIQTKETLS